MPSYFKNIFHFLLVAMVMMSVTSCARWREAKAVVAEADRLLGNEKRITRDTSALNFAIETLNGPLGYLFAKQELAKAYYFMGRNFYYLNDFATAADYYILCDRLNPKFLFTRDASIPAWAISASKIVALKKHWNSMNAQVMPSKRQEMNGIMHITCAPPPVPSDSSHQRRRHPCPPPQKGRPAYVPGWGIHRPRHSPRIPTQGRSRTPPPPEWRHGIPPW